MICPKCGEVIPKKLGFCPECGDYQEGKKHLKKAELNLRNKRKEKRNYNHD